MSYTPERTVARMLASNAFARVIKGPVGSGKSTGCVAELGRRGSEQAPFENVRRTRFAVIRNTYRELRDTTRKTFEQIYRPALGSGRWREADFAFEIAGKHPDGSLIESEILFRSLDKPGDVHKLLSLELTGAYVNELRELPKSAIDVLETRLGRYPGPLQGGTSWSGWWGDTNPWPSGHWGQRLFEKPPEGYELYVQPGGRSALAENVKNLPVGYYERMCRGKDAEWMRVYVDGEDGSAAEGSVYGRLLSALRQRGGVVAFDHDKRDVFTVWDFGIADSMAIWWFNFNAKRGVDVLDWYESNGKPLSHYFKVCDDRGYQCIAHYLPHDARARSWHTGRSAVELFEEWAGAANVLIAPELTVDDGIGAGRWLLEQDTTRFHARCDERPADRDYSGVEVLAEYRYVWDEVHKVFSKNPLHNFASHSADAYRVLACAVRHGEIISRHAPKEPPRPLVRSPDSFTFAELRDATLRQRSARHRRHV